LFSQSFPFRGRCPQGGWGVVLTVLPLQGKVPEGRMGPPTSPFSQSFPFRGRCPKGGWGPQLRRPHSPSPSGEGARRADGALDIVVVTVLPLQGKVPEGRMGPPPSSFSQSFPFRGRCPQGGWGPRHRRSHSPSPSGEGARRADGAPAIVVLTVLGPLSPRLSSPPSAPSLPPRRCAAPSRCVPTARWGRPPRLRKLLP